MKLLLCLTSAALALLLGAAALAGEAAPTPLQKPEWAYAVPAPTPPRPPGTPAPPRDLTLYGLPGTDKKFTQDQVNGRREPGQTVQVGPADWFPDEHPPMPPIVAYGDPARGILACSLCHYPSGKGRSENASVAGYSKAYLAQTLHDMRAGLRHSAEPRKANAAGMVRYAQAMTDAEIEAAAAYYASLPWVPWVKVVESTTAPKVRNANGLLLPLEGAEAGTQPLGNNRILEIAVDALRMELRDPHSGFVAYVPPGSIAKGKALAAGGGGRTIACTLCHGQDLNGLGAVPGIAGRSPSYMARQLNDMKQGARRGTYTPLMDKVVANLSEADILNLTAYVASLPVRPAR